MRHRWWNRWRKNLINRRRYPYYLHNLLLPVQLACIIMFVITIYSTRAYCVAPQQPKLTSSLNADNAVLSPSSQRSQMFSKSYNKQKRCEDENIAEGIAVDCVPISSSTSVAPSQPQGKNSNLRQRIKRWKVRQQANRRRDITNAELTNELTTSVPETNTMTSNHKHENATVMNPLPHQQNYYPYNSPLAFPHYSNNYHQQHQYSRSHNICEHNGTFINGKCHCFYPYTGSRCADFVCEHGLSVGPRYDPDSTFFNRKCICDEDWAGELCNIPIADQCNERGQYLRGRCKCHGYYFGPKCQYVGKCENGKLQEGICVCNYGYEGDYCDKIVCHHGYPDKLNASSSCICPPRHSGQFCDECMLAGEHILPFPNCTEERIPHHARASRQRTDDRIIARLLIILVMLALLGLLLVLAFIAYWDRQRTAREKGESESRGRGYSVLLRHREMMEERKQMLERAINAANTISPPQSTFVESMLLPQNNEWTMIEHNDSGNNINNDNSNSMTNNNTNRGNNRSNNRFFVAKTLVR